MSDHLSFKLSDDFIKQYETRIPNWGFDIGAGNSLGELTYITKYSRLKDDGSKERWYETCRRVIEGMFSIQKDHCRAHKTRWNDHKAQRTAQDAYERMFTFKWLPPGRGLWMMGTEFVMEHGSAALQNCGMQSTGTLGPRNPTMPFVRVMEKSMLGIGMGFDTLGAGKLTIHAPSGEERTVVIEDSREGWCASLEAKLRSYFLPEQRPVSFDYSLIRPEGSPIKGFGGTAAGPRPLMKLHDHIDKLFAGRYGSELTSTDIVDLMNLIGKCVVAGNVRRSAELALGLPDDSAFLSLKDWNVNPERMGADGWGHLSNNSVVARVGGDYDHIINKIAINGEPGLIYMDLIRNYGRLGDQPDGRDHRSMGVNPCAEQSLEDHELCVSGDTLIQTFDGVFEIKELVGKSVKVFNGEKWSTVSPFETGESELFRVHLSDGSYVDATPGHRWLARKRTERAVKEVRTIDLAPGMVLPEFELPDVGGNREKAAYVMGWVAGDGYVDGTRVLALVQENEYEILPALGGRIYKEQRHPTSGKGFVRVNVTDSVSPELGRELRNHATGLPGVVRSMDADSLREFFGGWIDTDGSLIAQPNTDHYVLYGSKKKLMDAQILLRRIGVNHSSVKLFGSEGEETNKGTRTYDLYRLLIPSYEAENIWTKIRTASRFGSRLKDNNAHAASRQIDAARKQKVVRVERLNVTEMTYCFDEPFKHQGVFGNSLTKQCTLVESFPTNHDSLDDYLDTLKVAYMYGKTVTLLPTHWEESNEVMTRNRRIGTSQTGLAMVVEASGMGTVREWDEAGYAKIKELDVRYSEWLGVRESIRMTSIKPSGTVSLLAGVTPGVHWPTTGGNYIRRQRFRRADAAVEAFAEAGYHVESDMMDPEFSVVVSFPTTGPNVRGERDVSIWEKMALAAVMQRHWADNQVSATFSFRDDEIDQISYAIKAFEGQLKVMSFLPLLEQGAYSQMPYEEVPEEQFAEMRAAVKPINWDILYNSGVDAEGERYCTTDKCELPVSPPTP